MTTQDQGNLLTLVQGHSDPNFQTSFLQKNTRLFEAKFHMELTWDVGMKMCVNDQGHMTKVASRPTYGKIFKYQLLRNQNTDNTETWYTASDTQVLPNLFKGWHWVDLVHFYAMFKFIS